MNKYGFRYLSHGGKELLATPSFQLPVVVVLFGPAKTQSAITAAAPTQESSSTQLDLAVINTSHGLGGDIPIGLGVEVILTIFICFQSTVIFVYLGLTLPLP